MQTRIARLGVGLGLALCVSFAHAGDVALDKVPQPVMEAIKARFTEAKVTGAAKEKTPEGQEIFEISLENKNLNTTDVTITPEGAIVLIENQITRKELPAPVLKTLEGKYPKARYKIVEQIIDVAAAKEETLRGYEVILMTPEKQLWAVELGLDGKIVKEEKQPLEEDEE